MRKVTSTLIKVTSTLIKVTSTLIKVRLIICQNLFEIISIFLQFILSHIVFHWGYIYMIYERKKNIFKRETSLNLSNLAHLPT